MSYDYTAGKLISNEDMSLVEMLRSSTGQTVFMPLTKKVAIIEETESKVVLFYKDKQLKEYSTFNDFYGYGSSKVNAVQEAQRLIKAYGMESDQNLHFKVLQTVRRHAAVLLEEPQERKKLKVQYINQEYFLNNPEQLEELKSIVQAPWSEDTYERNQAVREKIQLNIKVLAEDKVVWNSLGDL